MALSSRCGLVTAARRSGSARGPEVIRRRSTPIEAGTCTAPQALHESISYGAATAPPGPRPLQTSTSADAVVVAADLVGLYLPTSPVTAGYLPVPACTRLDALADPDRPLRGDLSRGLRIVVVRASRGGRALTRLRWLVGEGRRPEACVPPVPGTGWRDSDGSAPNFVGLHRLRSDTSRQSRFGANAAYGTSSCARPGREGVVAEVLHGVEAGDASMSWSLTPSRCVAMLGRERPRRVGVRVVALPHHVVHVQEVSAGHAELVVDEARETCSLNTSLGSRSPKSCPSTPCGARTCSRRVRGSTGSSRCRPRTARPSGRGTCEIGDQMRSAAACTMLIGVRVIRQSIGASGAVTTSYDDEPMCRHTTTCSSRTPARTGPSGRSGSSGARASTGSPRTSPRGAPWRPCAHLVGDHLGSQIAGSEHGMNRPG